jgi:hypothetical protein
MWLAGNAAVDRSLLGPDRSGWLRLPLAMLATADKRGTHPVDTRPGDTVAENKQLVVYAAAYETVDAALADVDAVEQLHKDKLIGHYDADVIDKEDGEQHVVKRTDRPHIRVIPEWFGGGTLPCKELHEAA